MSRFPFSTSLRTMRRALLGRGNKVRRGLQVLPAGKVRRIMLRGAKRAREDRAMWAAVKKRLGVSTFRGVSLGAIARAKRDLRYPLHPAERERLRFLEGRR